MGRGGGGSGVSGEKQVRRLSEGHKSAVHMIVNLQYNFGNFDLERWLVIFWLWLQLKLIRMCVTTPH